MRPFCPHTSLLDQLCIAAMRLPRALSGAKIARLKCTLFFNLYICSYPKYLTHFLPTHFDFLQRFLLRFRHKLPNKNYEDNCVNHKYPEGKCSTQLL